MHRALPWGSFHRLVRKFCGSWENFAGRGNFFFSPWENFPRRRERALSDVKERYPVLITIFLQFLARRGGGGGGTFMWIFGVLGSGVGGVGGKEVCWLWSVGVCLFFVWLSTCFVCLFSAWLSVCFLFVCLLAFYLHVCLFICLLFVCLFVFVCLLFVCLYVYLSACLFVGLWYCLLTLCFFIFLFCAEMHTNVYVHLSVYHISFPGHICSNGIKKRQRIKKE